MTPLKIDHNIVPILAIEDFQRTQPKWVEGKVFESVVAELMESIIRLKQEKMDNLETIDMLQTDINELEQRPEQEELMELFDELKEVRHKIQLVVIELNEI